mmetsp:Transcript_63624/g.132469  ORF Transcript_63624/g.132469 Transcript_63624/m.132469 type:complete len:338 (+) Transcript_63624:67-1080(+)
MVNESNALLPNRPQRRSHRAYAVAIVAVCLALAVSAIVVNTGRLGHPVELAQAPQAYYYLPQMAYPAGVGQPGMRAYVPVAPQQVLSVATAGGAPQPMVYYYAPVQQGLAGMQIYPGQSLNATGNATGNETEAGGDEGDEEEGDFVCTVDNIKALHAKVQPEWDTCKNNPRYEVPNKDAKRRLMGWVWEPNRAAGHAPPGMNHHLLLRTLRNGAKISILAGNGTNGTNSSDDGGGEDSMDPNDFRTMSECMQIAVGDACDKIAEDCDDAVCKHYYNEPEIEALCGICGIAAANDWGPFGSLWNAELWLVIILLVAMVITVSLVVCECCRRRDRRDKN